MPVSFLTPEQRSRYGVFNAVPDIAQLGVFFHLDADDRRRAMAANGARNQLGWSLQLGTARFLNCFLDDPEDIPAAVVDYVAEQLGLQAADLKGYGEKEARWDHQEQIRTGYGYTTFAGEQWFALACWLYKRAWTTGERPIVLFDLATHRLVEAKILLPGVTTLERLIAALRERVAARQYALLAAAPSPNQAAVLESLVKVEQGRRVSRLDRLRKSPTDVSSTGLVKALDRHVELRDLGAASWNLSAVPPGKIAALARFAHAPRAQAVAELAGDRKLATLVAFAATMAPQSADDAVEVFDLAVGDLLRTSAFKANKERMRTLKDLDTAAIVLREVWLKIRSVAEIPDGDIRAALDEMDLPAIHAAADVIGDIAREWASSISTCSAATVSPYPNWSATGSCARPRPPSNPLAFSAPDAPGPEGPRRASGVPAHARSRHSYQSCAGPTPHPARPPSPPSTPRRSPRPASRAAPPTGAAVPQAPGRRSPGKNDQHQHAGTPHPQNLPSGKTGLVRSTVSTDVTPSPVRRSTPTGRPA
ncbi:DUF4158 domain-containing protein [Nonomuraea polychroma]|uniref:DUF4158 domain-containing protein n=1 Tax=Nonomuraea polychroma TaxID=46176 RepID=UPI003D8D8F04